MKKNTDTAPNAAEAIVEELQSLAEEAERMAADSTPEAGNGVDTLRERFEALRERFGGLCAEARENLAVGAQGADNMIRTKPYRSLAIALGIGVVLGLALGRRK